MRDTLFSVVLPVHEQAQYIGRTLEAYDEAVAKIGNPYELIAVVNGSTDGSLEVCRSLQRRYSSLQVLSTRESGWGRAVRMGLAASRGDLLCYTNSARTRPEDLALSLIYGLAYSGVVIKANRKIRESWQRRFGSLLYSLECRALFDLSCWDINGTPKVFPRRFERLLSLTRNDDLIDAEFNIICRREAYPVLEIPIFSTRYSGGKSTTGYRSAVKMYWGVYQMWRTSRQCRR